MTLFFLYLLSTIVAAICIRFTIADDEFTGDFPDRLFLGLAGLFYPIFLFALGIGFLATYLFERYEKWGEPNPKTESNFHT